MMIRVPPVSAPAGPERCKNQRPVRAPDILTEKVLAMEAEDTKAQAMQSTRVGNPKAPLVLETDISEAKAFAADI